MIQLKDLSPCLRQTLLSYFAIKNKKTVSLKTKVTKQVR